MNIRSYTFVTPLLLPNAFVFMLNAVVKTNATETLAATNDILGITLLPFVGGLLFKNKMSYLLAASIPILLILSKSLFFTGAERIVVVGLVVFLGISLTSCTFAVVGRSVYQRHLARHSSGTARKRAAP